MIQEHIKKAQRALKSSEVLLDLGDTEGACNRAYYAMFDAAIAAMGWAGIDINKGQFKTHNGVVAAFSQNITKQGRVSVEMGRSLQRVQDLRQIADYLAEPVPFESAEIAVVSAKHFVSTINQLVKHPYRKPAAGIKP